MPIPSNFFPGCLPSAIYTLENWREMENDLGSLLTDMMPDSMSMDFNKKLGNNNFRKEQTEVCHCIDKSQRSGVDF